MLKLGVNVDHVATVRQARYPGLLDAHNCEPDVVVAALACERAGAECITVHLRADRRHIQEADVFRLRERLDVRLNLEMGNTPDILDVALRVRPDEVCLVPEGRREVTTEGGLAVAGNEEELRATVLRLRGAGIRVSLFVEPEEEQIDASAAVGADRGRTKPHTWKSSRRRACMRSRRA
jgi:pyridoxine 5-phosphate synthase